MPCTWGPVVDDFLGLRGAVVGIDEWVVVQMGVIPWRVEFPFDVGLGVVPEVALESIAVSALVQGTYVF